MHMPGHKGHVFLGCEPIDITEIDGADVLHHAQGIIRESENNAAELFGAGATFYSTEGSSLCIKAMLEALWQGAGTRSVDTQSVPYILAARNIHRSMVDACALLDMDIQFLADRQTSHICTSVITPDALRSALSDTEERPIGVYVTSPDYLGQLQDIAGLAKVCREFGVPLVVDNAHGAYLQFLEPSLHPIVLGAAMCCDSAHKTLPVLTGGAYLHVAADYLDAFAWRIPKGMALFGSTSPSYLILQSLDLCNRYLADGYTERLLAMNERLSCCRAVLRQAGFAVRETEPLKITIETGKMGCTGEKLAEALRQRQIECEYADRDFVVLMLTPENTEDDFKRLEAFAQNWEIDVEGNHTYTPADESTNLLLGEVSRACSIREAVFHPSEEIPVSQAEGRILGVETVSCPPAVPIAVCGERLNREMLQLFERYGIETVTVLTEEPS